MRRHRYFPGHRSPTDNRWHGAGRATDDDIQRRRPLENERVDEDVERECAQRKARGQQVHAPLHEEEAGRGQRQAEERRFLRLDLAGGDGPVLRPQHQLIDVAVEVHIHRVGPTGHDGAAADRGEDQPRRGETISGKHHCRNRRDDEKDDYARLRQSNIGEDRPF